MAPEPCPERVIYWGSGSTPAWRVLACLEEKNLTYNSKLIEFSKGGPTPPSHLACSILSEWDLPYYVMENGSAATLGGYRHLTNCDLIRCSSCV
jgi:hypothetical protein